MLPRIKIRNKYLVTAKGRRVILSSLFHMGQGVCEPALTTIIESRFGSILVAVFSKADEHKI
jgi:hypothetical protein